VESSHPRILVIDDDPVICEIVTETLKKNGYVADSANTGKAVSELFSRKSYPIVLCDILLPDTNGLELMGTIKDINPDTFVILFTGHASVDLAKEAIRQGAYDFITKPFTSSEIMEAVKRAENEQRANFSDITYTELKILHQLTVENRMTRDSMKETLLTFGQRTRESFTADALRIYLKDDISGTMLEKAVESGKGDFADEVTWYFLASRTMQSGGEVLLDPSDARNTDVRHQCIFHGHRDPHRRREPRRYTCRQERQARQVQDPGPEASRPLCGPAGQPASEPEDDRRASSEQP